MNDSNIHVDRVYDLAGAICDDYASESDFITLDSMVVADEAFGCRYWDYCWMHVMLGEDSRVHRALDKVRERDHLDAASLSPWESDALIATLPPAASSISFPASGFLSSSVHGPVGFLSGWPAAYLIATVIFGIGALIGAFTYVSHPVQIAGQSATIHYPLSTIHSSVVGRITGMVDCTWADVSTAPVSGSVTVGHKFALASGLMEITYDTGAKVLLQGPVNYEVESAAGGYLSRGKLTARVETRVEKSPNLQISKSPNLSLSTIHYPLFTIKTPTAIVTDLGTEFGVEVDKQGSTQSHVFQGMVEVQPAAGDGRTKQGIRLAENESIRVAKQDGGRGVKIQRDKVDPTAFVRNEQFLAMSQSRQAPLARGPSRPLPIYDKTLVAWVSLANLEQRGGAALSLVMPKYDGDMAEFDGIVLGEIAPGKWMAGSHGYARTEQDQAAYPVETAGPNELVQIAVVYDSTTITIYRNGVQYARYEASNRFIFEKDSIVLIGKRHPEWHVPVPTLTGSIEEARLYDVALRPETIAALRPNAPSPIQPLGQWTFEDGAARDSTGHFPMGKLRGNARIAGGRLILDGMDSYLSVPAAASSIKQKQKGGADKQ